MKIQIVSDVHLETSSKTKLEVLTEADVLVLAGDIHTKPKSLRKFFNRILKQQVLPIVYVLGNHEYYYSTFPDVLETYRTVCTEFEQVHLLEKETFEFEGVQFLGTTLWSDLSNPIDALAVQTGITDFKYDKSVHTPIIQVGDSHACMSPFVWTREHMRCREWLEEALANRNPRKPTVVVTHFVPSKVLRPPRFLGSVLAGAYESEMTDLMAKYEPELWVYGHNHGPRVDRMIYDTRVVCNQKGYYHEKRVPPYQPWIVEVE